MTAIKIDSTSPIFVTHDDGGTYIPDTAELKLRGSYIQVYYKSTPLGKEEQTIRHLYTPAEALELADMLRALATKLLEK